MAAVCNVLKAKVSPSAENRFRKSQPAEPYFSEHIPLINRGLEISAMKHRSERLTTIAHGVRTGVEPIVWPLPTAENRGPAQFPLLRGMVDNLRDRQRERDAAKDRFVLVIPHGIDKVYSRTDVDGMSFVQRRKLFEHDGSMEEWYRGRRMDTGSWLMLRFDDPGPGGPVWLTFQELRNMPEPDRSAVLIKYNGPIRRWYLERLEEQGEFPFTTSP